MQVGFSYRLPATAGRGETMKSISRIATVLFALAVLATVSTLPARADCGFALPKTGAFLLHQNTGEAEQVIPASVKSVASQSDTDPIVGMWSVSFVSGGTEIDHGLSQWHSDGTEFMNSGGLSPATQNFCMGVWKNVNGVYQLNHFAFTYDLSGNPTGTANIREKIKVGHPANTFSGSFTVDIYDLNGNLVAHVEGTITGTRITVSTPGNKV